jgi:hypothetical protein
MKSNFSLVELRSVENRFSTQVNVKENILAHPLPQLK